MCFMCIFFASKQFYCISIWLKVYYIVLKEIYEQRNSYFISANLIDNMNKSEYLVATVYILNEQSSIEFCV